MVGTVTTRHLLTHAGLIVHEFGPRCFARCVWRTMTAHHPVTFLECLPGFHDHDSAEDDSQHRHP
jgi:hypothetical protein